jgi:adenylate kinase
MINIVLFGAPGAGKGTQAAKLTEKYGFNHISTGDIIRAEIRRATPLGLAVGEAIACGELAPDNDVIEIIREYMESHEDVAGNIFDGFPRTIPQAEAFDKILAGRGLHIDIMMELVVPEEELVRRILLRGCDSGREDDANESVIRNRIGIYNARTAVVAEYYRAQGKYVAIDGSSGLENVFAAISAEVDKLLVTATH